MRSVPAWPTTVAITSLLLAVAPRARAGGYEVPDLGAEAMGRGAAFTAKADNGTALLYNVAGFAKQRGTSLQLDVNVVSDSFTFARAGAYTDNAQNPATPWGGRTFPKSENLGAAAVIPTLTASTDFGAFEKLTLAAGLLTPAGSGNRVFPVNVGGAPNPARYDSVSGDSLVVYPTLAGAYRVLPELDIGLAGHLVYGSFDALAISYADFGTTSCPNAEFRGCDVDSRLRASGTAFAASAGALWRPSNTLEFGLMVRSPWKMRAEGNVSTTPPSAQPAPIPDAKATLLVGFPLVLRAGARYRVLEGERESGDVELDATYEAWSGAEGFGPTVDIPSIDIGGKASPVKSVSPHGYGDTYSVRGGGAYNWDAPALGLGAVMTVRAGAFHDSTATSNAYTRVDVNTLDKFGVTVGAGLKSGAFTFNVAYAEIFSPSRTVTNGAIRPSNGLKNGDPVGANGALLGAVNNGRYEGHMRTLSLGIAVTFGAAPAAAKEAPAKPNASLDETAKKDARAAEDERDAARDDDERQAPPRDAEPRDEEPVQDAAPAPPRRKPAKKPRPRPRR